MVNRPFTKHLSCNKIFYGHKNWRSYEIFSICVFVCLFICLFVCFCSCLSLFTFTETISKFFWLFYWLWSLKFRNSVHLVTVVASNSLKWIFWVKWGSEMTRFFKFFFFLHKCMKLQPHWLELKLALVILWKTCYLSFRTKKAPKWVVLSFITIQYNVFLIFRMIL